MEGGARVHVSSSPALWYATRASGIAAYVILGVVVCIGLSMGGKARSERWPRFSVEDVHRFGGLLVGALIGTHVVTIALDSFLPFSILDLVVPFVANYRPLWTGLGIAAAELLLALAVTNHYRKRLPYSFWRKAHYANFAVWTLASLHGVMSGTDRGVWWLAVIYGLSIASVLMLLVWRFAHQAVRSAGVAVAGIVTGVAVPLVIVGPLYHAAPIWNATNIRERLTGRVIQNGTNLTQIVSFVGEAKGVQRLIVRADLLVTTRQLRNTSFQLEYLPSGDICRGTVTNIGLADFSGTCRMPNGENRSVKATWTENDAGDGVIGHIHLSG
ncbi:MAG: methionine sulfoxide reductase heme-binding subunit [Gaiellaceae bacterium]|jgi:sulfoxide reductase heme-binding subunit YedZ|nr:methionine sulfoxide reductase heme-binding subunit [Gaiellaceae bacterium]